MKKLLRRQALEIIAFVSGFALMAFELVAARILAPSIGSSMYVWTSVIGVIIASLSLGYYMGGRLADKYQRLLDVAWLCLISAVAVALVIILYLPVLEWVSRSIEDPRLQGVIASLILFAPASFLIGMKAPYLAKLKVTTLEHTGRSVASLSALNAIGGIVGVFVAGFILFGYVGSRETLAVITLLLVVSGWLVAPRQHTVWRVIVSLGVITIAIVPTPSTGVTSIDTATAHYQIYEGYLAGDTRKVRTLTSGPNGAQSGIYVDGRRGMVFWYTKEMARLVELSSVRDRILVLGGGTFTLPQYLAEHYPESTIDVVEIDPELERVAKTYFNYQPRRNINLIADDARGYINTTKNMYDIILVDVYSDTSVPFSLLTREYGDEIVKHLAPDGFLAANVIAAPAGSCREFLDAIDASYRTSLPYASYAVNPASTSAQERGNMILRYSYDGRRHAGYHTLTPSKLSAPYTDNFMPAERLQQTCQKSLD